MRRAAATIVLSALITFFFPAIAHAKKVVLWHAYSGDEEKALLEIVKAFKDAEVEVLMIPADALDSKLASASLVQQGPDVFIAEHHHLGEYRARNIVGPVGDAFEGGARTGRRGMTRVTDVRRFHSLSAAATDPDHPAHDFLIAHNARAVQAYAAGIRQQMADGLAHPDLDPESVARHLIAVWNGLQSQWLTDPAFDLADEIVQAWRRLTGQPAMEAKRALEAVIDRI